MFALSFFSCVQQGKHQHAICRAITNHQEPLLCAFIDSANTRGQNVYNLPWEISRRPHGSLSTILCSPLRARLQHAYCTCVVSWILAELPYLARLPVVIGLRRPFFTFYRFQTSALALRFFNARSLEMPHQTDAQGGPTKTPRTRGRRFLSCGGVSRRPGSSCPPWPKGRPAAASSLRTSDR